MMFTQPRRVLAIFVGLAALTLGTTACNRFGFSGHIENLLPATLSGKYGPEVRMTGWIQARRISPWRAFLTFNGMVPKSAFGDGTQTDFAEQRPDVEEKHGGQAGGIALAYVPPPRGVYHVCLHVVPRSLPVPQAGDIVGEGADVVECASLIQGRDFTERGKIEQFTRSGGVVTFDGWVRHVEGFMSSVGVFADGQYREPLSSAGSGWGARPDIDAIYGDGTTSFHYSFTDDPTVSRWCLSVFAGSASDPSTIGGSAELDCVSTPTP